MAKQIGGVYENLFLCAKTEFLKKGFKDASLRVIAQEAGTSTGSIYTRFGSKEGLFRSIVEPCATELKRMFLDTQETFHNYDAATQEKVMPDYTRNGQSEMLDYIYAHFEEFQLLLDASYGTRFERYLHELVDIEVEYTYKYMEVIGCPGISNGSVTEDFLHLVLTSYFSGMFEAVRRGMSREDAERYMLLLGRYHMAGFDTLFYEDPPKLPPHFMEKFRETML